MLAQKLGNSLTSNTAATISPNTYSIQTTGTEYVTNDGAAEFINPPEGSISVWTKVSTMSTSGFLFKAVYDTDNFLQILLNLYMMFRTHESDLLHNHLILDLLPD